MGGPIFRSGPNAAASIAPTLIRHCTFQHCVPCVDLLQISSIQAFLHNIHGCRALTLALARFSCSGSNGKESLLMGCNCNHIFTDTDVCSSLLISEWTNECVLCCAGSWVCVWCCWHSCGRSCCQSSSKWP